MRYLSALLCSTAFLPIYAQYNIPVFYDDGDTSPNKESLEAIDRYANALYQCDTINVFVYNNPSLRKTKNAEEIQEERVLKLKQLFKEEQLRPVSLNFLFGGSADPKQPCDMLIEGTGHFRLNEEHTYIPDTTIIDDRGWRVRCKVNDAALAKQITVEPLDIYDFLVETNTHAVFSSRRQIDISGLYKIQLPDSLIWQNNIVVLIPVAERLEGSNLLLTPCEGGFCYFLNGKSRAKTRFTNKQAFLSVPIRESAIVAVGRLTAAKEPQVFAAPPGFVLRSAELRSQLPDNYTRAVVAPNEILASFAAIPRAESVEFQFILEDLDGNQSTTDWLSMSELRKTYKCKAIKSDKGSEVLLLTDTVIVKPDKLVSYE